MTTVEALRREKLWTQKQLAHASGVCLRTIYSVEKGQPCRMDIKRRLLHALRVPFTDYRMVFTDPTGFAHHVVAPDVWLSALQERIKSE